MPRNGLWWLNAVALLVALGATGIQIFNAGLSKDLQQWLWVILLQIAPAVAIGCLALFALRRLQGRIALWLCGVGAASASLFWAYCYIGFSQSTARDVGLGIALLPIALLPYWGGGVGLVLLSEWFARTRSARSA
jgi:hypothetical protein